MRGLLLVILLTLPTAVGASQVHVTLVEDGYAVTFASNATDERIPVTHALGIAQAERVDEEGGDDDRIYRAVLPWNATRYSVEGREFALAAPPAPDASVRIAFVADIGTDANASRVIDAISAAKPDLVVIGGDLSYANGAHGPWNDWFELMEPLASTVPTMPSYGNHEDYCEEEPGQIEGCGPGPNEWHAHFALPNGEKLYYAFEWGPVRFTVLDTEAYVHAEGDHVSGRAEQEAFLNESLDADEHLWDIVTFHRPLRTTNARPHAAAEEARESLEPLLAGRAHMVLAAHLHAYERYGPLDNVTYVTSGGGGRPLYGDWEAEDELTRAREATHHFVLLEVTPTTLAMQAVRPDGSVLDEVTLEKPAPPRATPPTPPPATTPVVSATPVTTTPTATPPATSAPALPAANGTAENSTPAPATLAVLVALALAVVARTRRVR